MPSSFKFSSFVNIKSKRLLCCPSLWRVGLDTFCVKKQFKVVLIKARGFGSLQSPSLQFILGKLKSPTIHLYLTGNKSALHTSSLSFTLFSSSELGLR